jgi:uncharacterized protein
MHIIDAWVSDLQRVLGGEAVAAAQVRVGVFYTAVELATGETGVAFTPRDLADTVCCPRSAAAGPEAGRLAGRDAWVLGQDATSPVALRRAVAIAALNALSARALGRAGVPGGRVLAGVDALEAAGVRAEDRVAMVGAFVPYLKALGGRVAELWVLDKHRDALKEHELPYWRSPEDAGEVLAGASVVLITASALVEGGLDPLLAAAGRARRVILAGPTAPPWPRPFFERGVDVVGGVRVRDGQLVLQIVSEGGSGYLFERAAEKISIVRAGDSPGASSLAADQAQAPGAQGPARTVA